MDNHWRWAGARTIGTSHTKSGLPCQDFATCFEIKGARGNILTAVVADGAGSASHAEAGARLVCGGFSRAAAEYFKAGGAIEDLDEEITLDWVDRVRERINVFARRMDVQPRDCAATLVGVLAGPRSAVIIHIGDGAAVVREEGSSDWVVPSWPFHGEYASTTRFVTDDPAVEPALIRLPVRIDRLALFSDGLERLVLDHTNQTAHVPFFERMTAPVHSSSVRGHDRELSAHLRTYLDSKAVCDRTDDDKSLILGVRL